MGIKAYESPGLPPRMIVTAPEKGSLRIDDDGVTLDVPSFDLVLQKLIGSIDCTPLRDDDYDQIRKRFGLPDDWYPVTLVDQPNAVWEVNEPCVGMYFLPSVGWGEAAHIIVTRFAKVVPSSPSQVM